MKAPEKTAALGRTDKVNASICIQAVCRLTAREQIKRIMPLTQRRRWTKSVKTTKQRAKPLSTIGTTGPEADWLILWSYPKKRWLEKIAKGDAYVVRFLGPQDETLALTRSDSRYV